MYRKLCAGLVIAVLAASILSQPSWSEPRGTNAPRGTGGGDLSNSCHASFINCINNCNRTYPKGQDVDHNGMDSQSRCQGRCNHKYAPCIR